MSDSGRFIVMNVMNLFICNYMRKKLEKQNKKFKISKYLKFFVFVVFLFILNQGVYFLFEPPNLYEELQIPRNMPVGEVKQYLADLKIRILNQQNIPLQKRLAGSKKIDQLGNVLIHPARRLSYDTFGMKQTEYAWAFKSQQFILSSIIGSSVFYVICFAMNMINKNKDEIKQALKLEITLIIICLLWQIQIIMRTQSRFHQTTDFLDNIYFAFPIFERRDLMKILIFPMSNIFQFFFRYYLPNDHERTFVKIGKQPTLMKMTAPVRQIIGNLPQDKTLQQKFSVGYTESYKIEPEKTQLYRQQRHLLRNIMAYENASILPDEQIFRILKYFNLLMKRQAEPKMQQELTDEKQAEKGLNSSSKLLQKA